MTKCLMSTITVITMHVLQCSTTMQVAMHTAIIAITKLYIAIGIINSHNIIAIFKGDLGLLKRVANHSGSLK